MINKGYTIGNGYVTATVKTVVFASAYFFRMCFCPNDHIRMVCDWSECARRKLIRNSLGFYRSDAKIACDVLLANPCGPPAGTNITHGTVGARNNGQAFHGISPKALFQHLGSSTSTRRHAFTKRHELKVVLSNLFVIFCSMCSARLRM